MQQWLTHIRSPLEIKPPHLPVSSLADVSVAFVPSFESQCWGNSATLTQEVCQLVVLFIPIIFVIMFFFFLRHLAGDQRSWARMGFWLPYLIPKGERGGQPQGLLGERIWCDSKLDCRAPASMAQLLAASSHKLKVHGLDSWSGCGYGRETNWCLSLTLVFLLLSFPLCKVNKHVFRWRQKKKKL